MGQTIDRLSCCNQFLQQLNEMFSGRSLFKSNLVGCFQAGAFFKSKVRPTGVHTKRAAKLQTVIRLLTTMHAFCLCYLQGSHYAQFIYIVARKYILFFQYVQLDRNLHWLSNVTTCFTLFTSKSWNLLCEFDMCIIRF